MTDRPAWRIEQPSIGDMLSPVQCVHCRAIYDLGYVQVTGRYTDCTVWTSPCCGHPGIDDRPEVADRHYRKISRSRADRQGMGLLIDERGMVRMWP